MNEQIVSLKFRARNEYKNPYHHPEEESSRWTAWGLGLGLGIIITGAAALVMANETAGALGGLINFFSHYYTW